MLHLGGLDDAEALQVASRAGCVAPGALAFEGLKTLGLEIGELVGERTPEVILVDARTPGLAEAVHLGLSLLKERGLLEQQPRVAGVQADSRAEAEAGRAAKRALGLPFGPEGCAALAALKQEVEAGRIERDTLAMVVLEGPPPSIGSATFHKGRLVTDWASLEAWVRAWVG